MRAVCFTADVKDYVMVQMKTNAPANYSALLNWHSTLTNYRPPPTPTAKYIGRTLPEKITRTRRRSLPDKQSVGNGNQSKVATRREAR